MKTNEPLYDDNSLADPLKELDGWGHETGWLVRTYKTDGWRTTMMAVNAIGFLAEAANHHPDLEVHWDSVVVKLQTHSAGGVTDKDLELAREIERTICWLPNSGFPGLEGQPGGWISR